MVPQASSYKTPPTTRNPYWTSSRAKGAAATGQFLAGIAKSYTQAEAEYKEASEKERYAEQILSNYFKNVARQRANLSRFVTERADEGGASSAQVARMGDLAVGRTKTAVTSSGAVAGEGTTQDIVVEQAFDAWYAQQQVAVDTYGDIEKAETGFTQWKNAEYEQTVMNYKNLYRSAYLQREQAEIDKSVGMFSSAMSAMGSYAMWSA